MGGLGSQKLVQSTKQFLNNFFLIIAFRINEIIDVLIIITSAVV